MVEIKTLNLDEQTVETFQHFMRAVSTGFNGLPSANTRTTELALEIARKDRQRVRAVWDTDAGIPESPVATFASWDGTINAGADLVTANFISAVTVRPTHKRRGILRAMMTADLDAAVERGTSIATLTASDARIYKRFGFGRATTSCHVEIDSGRRFTLNAKIAGRCEFAHPEDVVCERDRLFEQAHSTRRGSHSRPAEYGILDYDLEKQAEVTTLRAVVHYGPDGDIDGVGLFYTEDEGRTVQVRDLQYADPAAEIALWALLCNIELSNKVTYWAFDPDSALPWALNDPRVIQMKPQTDLCWLRILDVRSALQQRGFEADGDVTLDVADSMGYTNGRFRVVVRQGRAEVQPTEAPADLHLDVAELASLYLGLGDARVLAGVGLAHGPGVDAVHDLFAVRNRPWGPTFF